MQIELMKKIESTSSRSAKERLLASANPGTQRMLKYALDPHITYGVTLDAVKLDRTAPAQLPAYWWDELVTLLDQLAARSLTGHAAIAALDRLFVRSPSEDHTDWACRIIRQDLRCGVSLKTVQKVFPDLIQAFEVALAQPYDPAKHDLSGIGHIEPKLDGLRVTVVDGLPYTRNGNRVQGADAMISELTSILDGARILECVFDGEFIGDGTFEDTVSKARTHGQDNRGLVYHVFDLVRRDEWTARQTRPFAERRSDLERIVPGGDLVRVVPSIRVVNPTMEAVLATRDAFLREGYEGAMWKANLPYQFKRSSALLKLKRFDSIDGTVVAVEEGRGKYAGMLGAIVVRLPDGTEVNVGSGYTDAQREQLWREAKSLQGETIEIQYQNRTSKGSLRFPVFVRLREDK